MLKNFILTINYITMNFIQRSMTYRYKSFSHTNSNRPSSSTNYARQIT